MLAGDALLHIRSRYSRLQVSGTMDLRGAWIAADRVMSGCGESCRRYHRILFWFRPLWTDAMSTDEPIDTDVPRSSRRRVLTAAAGVGVASLATGTAAAHGDDDGGSDEDEEPETTDDGDEEETRPFAAVEFSNQGSDGTEIVVDSTTLSDGGYVAIHDATLFQGAVTGSVIGVSEYLEPGVHYSVRVSLFDVSGAGFERHSLEGTAPLVAMPHRETSGNETYEFVESGGEKDGPYTKAGQAVIDAGLVTIAD